MTTLAANAIEGLTALGATNPAEAERLLGSWARRAQLTEADRTAVLAAFERPRHRHNWPAYGEVALTVFAVIGLSVGLLGSFR